MQDESGAFRYGFAYGDYAPGWVSALAQGQGLSVLARAYLLAPDPRLLAAGDAALQFLLRPLAQGGVRDDLRTLDPTLARHLFLQEWPATPPNYTLNGFMWTGLGLYDWSVLGLGIGRHAASHDAAGLYFSCSVQTIVRVLPYYDAGGFSTYNLSLVLGMSEIPRIAPYYHAIHLGLLQAYYSITARGEFREIERRWADYVDQPIAAP
jgi:hypothetical protein